MPLGCLGVIRPRFQVAMALDMVRGWGAFTDGKSGTGFMISEQLIGALPHAVTPPAQCSVAADS